MGPTYPSYLSNMTSKTYKVLLCLMGRRRSLIPIALLLSWFVASSAPAGAQTRHPMTLVELAELQRMFSPQLSPDGKTLLFLRDGQLWLMPADGGEPRALSKHATGIASGLGQTPTWSPDGTLVYFL